jgi:hypothetical protein
MVNQGTEHGEKSLVSGMKTSVVSANAIKKTLDKNTEEHLLRFKLTQHEITQLAGHRDHDGKRPVPS